MNSSVGENRGNLSNFLNNECINIYVTWCRLYNFLLGGRDRYNRFKLQKGMEYFV